MDISNDEVSSIQTYYLLLIGIDILQLADMLSSKTMPEVSTKKKPMHALKPTTIKVATVPPKKKARACSGEVEEVEDKDSACNINARNSSISPTSSFQILGMEKVTQILYRRYFSWISVSEFEKRWPKCEKEPDLSLLWDCHQWACRYSRRRWDIHYHCLHGAHKLCTIRRSMRSNLNGVQHNFCLLLVFLY